MNTGPLLGNTFLEGFGYCLSFAYHRCVEHQQTEMACKKTKLNSTISLACSNSNEDNSNCDKQSHSKTYLTCWMYYFTNKLHTNKVDV
mmetsp:Transcript_21875/g.35202  ORF Transcript_21875/g.35202 Transcript_21875/m.35202 type:complete len:88 (+) Transcript_21875:401-664(+)